MTSSSLNLAHDSNPFQSSGSSPTSPRLNAAAAPVVLKFGGSVLTRGAALDLAVDEVHRERTLGRRVIAVVSGLAGHTDALLADLARAGDELEGETLADYLAGAEREAAAGLGQALERAGIEHLTATVAEIDLRAVGDSLDATPVRVNVGRIEELLAERGVLVLPGFEALGDSGRSVLLGRGGSDLTAVFLAAELGAELRLLKDTGAVYERDPRVLGPAPKPLAALTWRTAAQVGGDLIQPKALALAEARGLEFIVAGLGAPRGTRVGEGPSRLAAEASVAPCRIAIAGLGTVGGGVLRRLLGYREAFHLVGVLVRDPELPRPVTLAREAYVGSGPELLDRGPDILIELIGDDGVATPLVEAALERGIHVVTANKQALAKDGARLRAAAARGAARLLHSAAAGGVVPVLEAAERLAGTGVTRVEAVLNGTCNAIFGELEDGRSFEEALTEAQRVGLAEADPSLDLSGLDAAYKLVLIAHELFGERLEPGEVVRQPFAADTARRTQKVARAGGKVRQVAHLERLKDGSLEAVVRFEQLERDSVLLPLNGPQNVARFYAGGDLVDEVRGAGAGRWPTATAVLGDLLKLRRERCPEGVEPPA